MDGMGRINIKRARRIARVLAANPIMSDLLTIRSVQCYSSSLL